LDVLLGVLRTINVYGTARGIEHCYLLVTEAFARLLRRMGVVLRQAGSAVDYRGFRTPYVVSLRESAASMRATAPAIERLFSCERLAYRRSSEIDEDTVDPDSLLIGPALASA
jgi:N-acyl-L-homoserine lactone synthetase